MCKSTAFKIWLFIIVLMMPWAVHAAGLGKLTVNSALGWPFQAEIDLVAVRKEEIPSLTARLASREAFRKADVDYAPFLPTFTVSIETRSDGQLYVKIISPQPVVEPFLSMLIELNWASGRLLREYTVLLDLPEPDIPQIPRIPQPIAAATQITSVAPIVESESAVVEKPDAPIKDFISDKKLVAREPVQVDRAGVSYGPVKNGDTLSRIARQFAPDRINLNQMLIALHRVNRDAFSGNDINRLKTGAVLQVPDSSEISRISPAEAAMKMKTLMADWNIYRQKLAATPSVAPFAGAPKQTATGKITTIIEDNFAAAKDPSKEVLKLSKSEALSGGVSGKGINALQDRIRAMEEDAIARNKELNEANERIALLEKNIKEMQRLLEFKSATMVEVQKRTENIKPDVALSPAPAPVVLLQPTPAPVPAVLAEPAETNVAPVAPDASLVEAIRPVEPAKPAVKPTVAQVVPPPIPVESSLMDSLMGNIEYIGGALVLLLAGILGVSMMRRKKEASADSSDGIDGSDVIVMPHVVEPRLHDKVLPVAAPAPAPSVTVRADEVDPIAEAEIYLNYGRDTQAEKTLTDALVKYPDRPEILAKLLEVYVLRKDKAAFEATARVLQAVAPSSPLWEKAAGLGAEIDPENPLYRNAVTTNIGAIKSEVSAPVSDSPQNVTTSEITSGINFDMGNTAPASANQLPTWKQATEPDFGIKFDSEDGGDDHESPVITNQSTPVTAPIMPGKDWEKTMVFDLDAPAANAAVKTSSAEDMGLTFSVDFPATSESKPKPEPVAALALDPAPLPESGLADINLNLGEPLSIPSADTKSTESVHWHEIATKIDLARAYQEMGDNDGAREILEEVVREGDAQQQERAKKMLASL